jgi:predicted secreted protein
MPTTIEWSDEEMQYLIDLRRERNDDYWRRFGRSKLPFWNEIAEQIQERFTTAFNGLQAREKFKGMVRDCKVSKLLVNKE